MKSFFDLLAGVILGIVIGLFLGCSLMINQFHSQVIDDITYVSFPNNGTFSDKNPTIINDSELWYKLGKIYEIVQEEDIIVKETGYGR